MGALSIDPIAWTKPSVQRIMSTGYQFPGMYNFDEPIWSLICDRSFGDYPRLASIGQTEWEESDCLYHCFEHMWQLQQFIFGALFFVALGSSGSGFYTTRGKPNTGYARNGYALKMFLPRSGTNNSVASEQLINAGNAFLSKHRDVRQVGDLFRNNGGLACFLGVNSVKLDRSSDELVVNRSCLVVSPHVYKISGGELIDFFSLSQV
jgi:hypothetical protein